MEELICMLKQIISEGTTAYMWITNKIQEFANRIRSHEQQKLSASISDTPKHLIE